MSESDRASWADFWNVELPAAETETRVELDADDGPERVALAIEYEEPATLQLGRRSRHESDARYETANVWTDEERRTLRLDAGDQFLLRGPNDLVMLVAIADAEADHA